MNPRLPLAPSPEAWLHTAMANLPAVHQDHLHCERKAALSALSLARSYPADDELVLAVSRLAHEETAHIVAVTQIMQRQGLSATFDDVDDYAAALRALIRKSEPARQLDRLVTFAIIEGRSAERLSLLALHLPDARDRELYEGLASAEHRHRDLFLELAMARAPRDWEARVAQLVAFEADLLRRLPTRPRIH